MAKRTKDQNEYSHGEWNAVCQVCGFKFKARDLRERWDGLRVCRDDWEARHVTEFQKTEAEDITVPFSIPDDSSGS